MQSWTRWTSAALLGLATIGAYGTAYYSIGVLIPAISADTGWSAGVLAAGFSLGVVGQAALALLAGRLLDRNRSRLVLIVAITAGAVLFSLSSFAEAGWQFALTWAMGGAMVGGGLYYNVTMPLTSRLYPDNRPAAISVLTLFGALASPIFYPVAGWLIDMWGWRGAIQGLTGLMVLSVAPAAIFVRTPAPVRAASLSSSDLPRKAALLQPAIQRLLLAMALVGIANSALVLHQVPAMQAAGLSLAAASGFAGARGAFQIPGRLLLTFVTSRLGVRGAIVGCYAVAATASVALLLAIVTGPVEVMVVYLTVAGGMSLGLLSPLNGLFQVEVFGEERLGTLSGVAVTVASIATATGGMVSGLLVGLTGSYEASLVLSTACFSAAIPVLLWQGATAKLGVSRSPAATS